MRCLVILFAAALLLTGCVGPKIDWGSRLGHYTYDQSVMEFGPPERLATLTDGSIVAEWLTRHAQVIVQPDGPYFGPPYAYPMFPPTYSQTYIPGTYLRLTFGPTKVLIAQKYVRK